MSELRPTEHFDHQSLTHALFDLAAHPEYIQPLREEIERVVADEGWTKSAFTHMWKLDSFLKESHRYNGMSFRELLHSPHHVRASDDPSAAQ